MADDKPLRSFRESPWRYSQFVVLGLIVAGLVKWLSPLGWVVVAVTPVPVPPVQAVVVTSYAKAGVAMPSTAMAAASSNARRGHQADQIAPTRAAIPASRGAGSAAARGSGVVVAVMPRR